MSQRRVVRSLICVVSLSCLSGSVAQAQAPNLDSPVADAAHHKVVFENDQVRVVHYVIAPHDKTSLHYHPALVSVLLTDANAKATSQDGKTSEIHGKAGSAAWRGPTIHVVENVSDQPLEGILVEPKGTGNTAWKPPARDLVTLDPAHHKVEFENDLVRIERYWAETGMKSPMHDHPDHVQIALTDANTRATSIKGNVTEGHLKAGEARYRKAFSHAVENVGPRYEGLIVALKSGASGAR